MSQAPELPPVALVHPLRLATTYDSIWRAGWGLLYGRPGRRPVLVSLGLN